MLTFLPLPQLELLEEEHPILAMYTLPLLRLQEKTVRGRRQELMRILDGQLQHRNGMEIDHRHMEWVDSQIKKRFDTFSAEQQTVLSSEFSIFLEKRTYDYNGNRIY